MEIRFIESAASLPQFRSLKIEATEKEIRFSTCTPLEQITFRMESPPEGSFHCIIPFEEFRMALRSCRNKTLELEYREGILRVGETTLLHEQSVEWPIICKGEQEAYSELPNEFLFSLAKAAPLVDREEARAIMRGINLSREGITATNGRELLHAEIWKTSPAGRPGNCWSDTRKSRPFSPRMTTMRWAQFTAPTK